MNRYVTERIARDRVRERLREAENERLARIAAAHPKPGRTWRVRWPHAVVRRLVRVLAAS